MASPKMHEINFSFNAIINGGFHGAFTKAQQEFNRLSGEIKNVQKLQADISSYQKQQAAVDATTAKLKNLRAQEAQLTKELEAVQQAEDQDAAAAAHLEREKLKLQQRIDDTGAALGRQSQKLDATKERLKEAEINTEDLAGADAELTKQIEALSAQQDEASKGALTFGEKAAQAFSGAGQALAAAGIAAGLKEVADAYMECITVAGNFEESMSNVEALSGANAAEMDALAAKAKDLGAATKFTAQESGDAMGYMAMAGWNAQEMVSGMNGVINLAAASGEDLASVSDIVTDSLSAFKLKAADSAHFSDVLAQTATKSNTNVSLMGESLKYVASLCGTLGYSVEDAAVNLGLMANNGIKGSQAGTALKTSLANLSAPTDEQAKMMQRLDISMTDAGGRMLSLSELTGNIRTAFSGLSEAQQAEAASTLFGKEAMAGMLAVINTSQADYDSLTNSIQNSAGAAERMAAIKLDNMNGQLTLLNSAWEAVQTTVGEQFTPTMKDLYGAGADVLTNVNAFLSANPSVIKGVTAAGIAFGGAAVGITGVTAAMKLATAAAAIFKVNMGVALGPLLGVVAAGSALVGIAVAVGNANRVTADETYELTAVSREQYQQLQELNAEYEKAAEKYGENSYEAQQLQWKIEDLNTAYENGRETFEDYQAAHDAAMDSYQAVADARNKAAAELDNEEAGTDALIKKLQELSTASGGAAKNQDAIRAIVDKLNESLPELNLNYGEILSSPQNFTDRIFEVAEAAAEAKRKQAEYDAYVDSLAQRGTLESAKKAAKDNLDAAQEDYNNAKALYDKAKAPYQRRSAVVNTQESRQAEADMKAAQAQIEAYQANLDEASKNFSENEKAIAEYEESFRAYTEAMREAAEAPPTLADALSQVSGQADALATSYEEAYKAASESINGQYALWDEAAEVIPASVADLNKALEGQRDYWKNYNADLQTVLDHASEFEGLSEMVAAFADGSEQSVNMMAGIADALESGDLAAVQNAIKSWQELEAEKDKAKESLAQVVTDFPGQMDELQSSFEETVQDMDLSELAESSAYNTIQALIDKADSMLPSVQRAYAKLGRAMSNALGMRTVAASQSGGRMLAAPSSLNQNQFNAYAGGTERAAPGFALVGENGPEVVYFQGGERVLTASETAAAQRQFSLAATYNSYAAPTEAESAIASSPGEITINLTASPVYQLNGGAVPEDLQEQLKRNNEDLREIILDAVQEALIDARRGSIR